MRDVIDEVVRTTLIVWAIFGLDDLRLIRFLDIALERGFDVNTLCEGGEPLYWYATWSRFRQGQYTKYDTTAMTR